MKLILASTSPNRRELFDRMGVEYQAVAPDYEEIIDNTLEPFAQVEAFALGKGQSVVDQLDLGDEDYLVMGGDSMIEFEGGSLADDDHDNDLQDPGDGGLTFHDVG